MESTYLINETFDEKEEDYYILFTTPNNIHKKIEKIEKIQLRRTSPDSIELKITTKNNKTHIYHYPNGLITLLNNIDIGIINRE